MLKYLYIKSPVGAIAVALLLFAGVGALDHVTGLEISVAPFYLLPVTVMSLRFERWGAVLSAIGAAILWRAVDDLSGRVHSHGMIPVANALSRFIFFWAAGSLPALLWRTRRQAEEQSRTDTLTGAANGLRFYERLNQESAAPVYSRGISLAYLDLDNFKQVNDLRGHTAGDQVLQLVFAAIQRNLRAEDLGARLGGDEFAVLLPNCDAEDARNRMETVREAIRTDMAALGLPVTASVGVLHFERLPEKVSDAVTGADTLMYRVKHSGKNSLLVEHQ